MEVTISWRKLDQQKRKLVGFLGWNTTQLNVMPDFLEATLRESAIPK